MALVQCGGIDVLSGRILMPRRGTWVADLRIDSGTVLSGSVTVEADGGLSLNGTVTSSGVFLDACHVRVVGGAGKLATEVSGAYRSAQLRDPLGTIMSGSGEKQASSIAASVLGLSLNRWTLGKASAARCLDDLAAAATSAIGTEVVWRVLEDGTIWIGSESWPTQDFPVDDEIADQTPETGLYILAVSTLWLKPGVDLDNVGKIQAVEHFVGDDVRTYAWT